MVSLHILYSVVIRKRPLEAVQGKAVSHSENLQTIQTKQQSVLKTVLLRVVDLHGGTAGMGFFLLTLSTLSYLLIVIYLLSEFKSFYRNKVLFLILNNSFLKLRIKSIC